MKSLKLIYQTILSLAVGGLLVLSGCADDGAQGTAGADGANGSSSPSTRTQWVSDADWNNATTIQLTMTGTAGNYSYVFSSSGDNTLTLTSGQPYILQIINPASADAKHYLSTKPNMGAVDMPGDFYQAIAVRKVQTADAEYKAPYFKALELLQPGTQTMVELYFVPVLTGTYYIYCQQPGHEAAGMLGSITITGDATNQLDLGVDPLFDTSLLNPDPSFSWTVPAPTPLTVTMSEDANGGLCTGADTFCFTGTGVTAFAAGLTSGNGYIITLTNPVGNSAKHYFTAPDFYKSVHTRKAPDSHGEIKVPYFDAVELRNSTALLARSTDLYVIPTFSPPGADGYSAYCTVGTHALNGMNTLIEVP